MGTKQKEKSRRTAARSCDRCVHKSVCILYYGHGQLELRFGKPYSKDPEAFVAMMDERLSCKCLSYLEAAGGSGE